MALFRRSKNQAPPELPARRREFHTDLTPTFQRGRTLAGAGSFSEGREAQSDRVRAHALAQRRRRVLLIFGLVLAVIIFLLLIMSQLVASVEISSSDDVRLDSSEKARYEKVIDTYLDNHPVERLRFALNQGALTEYVDSKLPEVEGVKVGSFDGLTKGNFTLSFRHPVAGWQISGQQYYVDTSGAAFSVNYFAEPGVQIIDQSGASVGKGSEVTSARFLSFIGRIVAQAQSRGYTVTQAILPTGTTRELDIHVSGVGEVVKFSIDRGPAEQVEDMANAFAWFKAHGVNPGYVDLRISGRAYYK